MKKLTYTMAAVVLLLPAQAKANMPVLDTSNLAKNAEMVAQTAELVSSAAEQVIRLTNITDAIGLVSDQIQDSAAGKLLGSALSIGNSVYGTYQSINNVGMNIQRIGNNVRNLPDNFFAPLKQAHTPAGAWSAVNKLMTPNTMSYSSVNEYKRMARGFLELISKEAMSLAIFNRESTAKDASSTFDKLTKTSMGSNTIKSQNAATHALLLSVIQELQQTRVLLASYVQMEAAHKFHPRNYDPIGDGIGSKEAKSVDEKPDLPDSVFSTVNGVVK